MGGVVDIAVRIVTLWTGPRDAHVMLQGRGGDPDVVVRLEAVLERLLTGGARHLVVDLHRLTHDDTGVVELLAAMCHRLWPRGGSVHVRGLRHRLISNPGVVHFPEVFGGSTGPPWTSRRGP